MSRKAIASLGLAIISILGITIGLGQGCADSGTMGGLGGFAGGVETTVLRSVAPTIGLAGNGGGYGGMVGNGGGYGGMVSVPEGQYGGRQSVQVPQAERSSHRGRGHHHDGDFHLGDLGFKVYLRAGEASPCKRYPKDWEEVGPQIAGEVAISESGVVAFYLPTACATPRTVRMSAVSVVDFNTDIAVFDKKVFEKAEELPPPVESLEETVAYCRSAITVIDDTQIGTDVRIYRSGDVLRGDLVMGKEIDGKPNRLVVRGFGVTENADDVSLEFTTQGFSLEVTKGETLPVSGALSVLLDGEQLDVPMEKCWY